MERLAAYDTLLFWPVQNGVNHTDLPGRNSTSGRIRTDTLQVLNLLSLPIGLRWQTGETGVEPVLLGSEPSLLPLEDSPSDSRGQNRTDNTLGYEPN